MLRTFMFFGAALLAAGSVGQAQSDGKKNDASEVEVSFVNGSVVRMTLVSDKIEIVTPYGKLSVPPRDVRRIDFGLHLPDGADKKIEAAIKHLSSAEFKERDAAGRELVALGVYAYPALLQAAKSTDQETARRAQDAINKIKTKVPAKDLRTSADDKITTPTFTIVGRIVTKSLKAKTDYFGEVDMALAHLRQVRFVSDGAGTDVTIDAAKYANAGQWMETGISIDRGMSLIVAASGEVDLRPQTIPGSFVCGPRGYTPGAKGGKGGGKGKGFPGFDPPAGRIYPGTLLGRIGDNGESFIIGERFEGVPDGEGKLYLHINPSLYEANSTGNYQVRISTRH